jgi:hypothetical protein
LHCSKNLKFIKKSLRPAPILTAAFRHRQVTETIALACFLRALGAFGRRAKRVDLSRSP